MKQIEIDWEINQLIEIERTGFDEPHYVALRRLLKLPAITDEIAKGKPWEEDGVLVPHGSLAKMSYLHGKQVYEGQFLDGKLVVNGKSYKTLSQAASDLAVTKAGKKTNLNGWGYWSVKFPGRSRFSSLAALRRRTRK